MGWRSRSFLILLCMGFGPLPLWGFKAKAYYLGLGYLSESALFKTTSSPSGGASFNGASTFPVFFKYDFAVSQSGFLSPQLSYTPLARKGSGGSVSETLLHLSFPFGANFGSGISSNWEWSFGPGVLMKELKGAGGLVVLNNGTSSAVFAQPGRVEKATVVTLNLGVAWSGSTTRLGFDLITEGALSNKRTFSYMLSYAYRFGGGW